MKLTTEFVRELFDYDQPSGNLIWKAARATTVHAGDIAGCRDSLGYKIVSINHNNYKVHRLVWLWHGRELSGWMDHIDGNPSNSRIENLRLASPYENSYNSAIARNNSSGVKGVYFNKDSNKYMVRINVSGKRKYLGMWDDLEFAQLVAEEARRKYHGEFARLK